MNSTGFKHFTFLQAFNSVQIRSFLLHILLPTSAITLAQPIATSGHVESVIYL